MRVLSFFTRKIITPHKIIVNNGKAIFDISILLYISYQLFISLDYIINEHNRTMPLLYDGVISESDNLVKRENLMEDIKQFDFFKFRRSNVEGNKKTNDTNDIVHSPPYAGNIKLVGVLKHTEESKSIAIIDVDGKQRTYFIGNEIESTNVIIVMILDKGIIIIEKELYYKLTI